MNHALLIAVKAYVSACNVTEPSTGFYTGTLTFNTLTVDSRTNGERELADAKKKVDCEKATVKMLNLLNGEKCSE